MRKNNKEKYITIFVFLIFTETVVAGQQVNDDQQKWKEQK